MTAKHSPATSLPWAEPVNYGASKFEIQGRDCRLATIDKLPDAAYIVHAANAYQKLVEALREISCLDGRVIGVNRDEYAKKVAEEILRELGEAE